MKPLYHHEILGVKTAEEWLNHYKNEAYTATGNISRKNALRCYEYLRDCLAMGDIVKQGFMRNIENDREQVGHNVSLEK